MPLQAEQAGWPRKSSGVHDRPAGTAQAITQQESPASLGRTLTYYGYLRRSAVAGSPRFRPKSCGCQQLVLEIDQQGAQLKTLENDTNREMTAVEHARADRADAMAALTKQVATGNQELANLKREEQASNRWWQI